MAEKNTSLSIKNKTINKEKLSYIYVFAASMLWGSAPSVGKIMLKNLNSYQLLFYVSLTASISLFIICCLQGKFYIIKSYDKKDYLNFAYMSFIGVFLYYIFYYGGLTYAPVQEAFIVNYTWPVWVVIFAILILKEPFNIKKLAAIILGFIGIYLVAAKGQLTLSFSPQTLKGDILAMLGAICYGTFSVLGKKQNYERYSSTMFYYIFAFIYIAVYLIVFSSIPKISLKQLLGIIWMGTCCSGLASVCWFLALKYGDTAKMSNAIFITPFISLVYIFFILGEKILISSFIGLVFIATGIIIENYKGINIKKYNNHN